MPHPIFTRASSTLLVLSLAASLAHAQALAPATAGAPKEANAPVQLSPFEVNTDKDTGFAAASSMAGGRLATDLRDTPVAYSVITRDFIDALNLTDLQSAAEWTTSSTTYPDNGQQNFFFNPIQYTVRGVGAGRPQRNFFPQFNNGDSYNLERYDFGRGPNAVLFGNGSLGGISSSTTKRAQTHRPSRQLQFAVGSWRNYRATFDVNQPLSEVLAIRAAGVWGDASSWRMKDYDKREAVFLTTTFKPWRHGEFRVEGEYGTNSRQSASTFINDRFSGWDGTTFNAPRPLATLPSTANAQGINRRGANYFVYQPFSAPDTIFHYQNDPITVAGGNTAQTPIAGFTYGTNLSFNTAGANLLHEINVPAGRFANAERFSSFRTPPEEFTMSPDLPILAQRFKDLQLTFNQRWGNLHFEIAGDINRTSAITNGEPNRDLPNIFIDINRVLPDGRANPNFLVPYGDGQFMRGYRTWSETNGRAAIAYVWPTRFGHFTVNSLGGSNNSETTSDHRYLSVKQGNDPRRWAFSNQRIRIRRYWNSNSRPTPDLSLRPLSYFDPNPNPAFPSGVSIQPIWAIEADRRDTQTIATNRFKYALASLNAKFFKGRWVVLGAVRKDSYFFQSQQQIHQGDYPSDWNAQHRILRPGAPADYATLTFTPRDANGNATGPVQEAAIRPRDPVAGDRLPQYANVRFKDDFNPPPVEGRQITRSIGTVLHLASWLNPAINFAETFNPPGSIVRIDGRQLEPTVATGIDYSLRMELFENKLNLNFTYYTTEEVNNTIPQDGPAFFNNLYDANVVGDTSATGRNIRGFGRLPNQYRDTRTRSGDGYEFEVTFNPTRALRLTGNIGFPRLYEANAYPDVRAYIDKNADAFRQIARDAGVLIGPDNIARVDESIPINQRSSDVNNAVTAYNNIYSFRRNIVDGKRLAQDQPVANLFADYTLQSGRLKGLRVGAGVRYRGKQIFWSKVEDTIPDPNNPRVAIDDPTKDAYTPAYTPDDYKIVTATASYTWRFKNRREVGLNLVINNLLNDRGPTYSASAQNAHVMRPLNNDYTSPARETVPRYFAFKQPINYTLTLTTRM
ncbi:MAG: TonB-dependent receptor plug domain-containing protein [Opitutaceae bacterium]|nr:TonB-dependent receptor plug domain-containing protein [Opitutaceae bacterium]